MPYSDAPIELPCSFLGTESPAEELYRVGLIYAEGIGIEADIIAAHKWFNLAAAQGSEAARTARQEMADRMTADEIAEAQKAAREWMRLMN